MMADTRRIVLRETALSIALNTAMAGIMTWLMADMAALATGALRSLGFEMFMSTMGPSLLFVPALTKAMRRQPTPPDLDRSVPPLLARLPVWLPWRTLSFAAVALVALALPGTAALAWLASAAPLTFARLMLFKLAYGALYGLILTPAVVLAALWDTKRPARAPNGATAKRLFS
jgi:membrane protein implicated in regulation of membrane protease activity